MAFEFDIKLPEQHFDESYSPEFSARLYDAARNCYLASGAVADVSDKAVFLPFHAARQFFTLPANVTEQSFPDWVRSGHWTSLVGRNEQLERVFNEHFRTKFASALFQWIFDPRPIDNQFDRVRCATFHWSNQVASRKSPEGPTPLITHHISEEEFRSDLYGMSVELPGALWMKEGGVKVFKDSIKAVAASVWTRTVIMGMQALLRAHDDPRAAMIGPGKYPVAHCSLSDVLERDRSTFGMINKHACSLSRTMDVLRTDLAHHNAELKHMILSHKAVQYLHREDYSNLLSCLEQPDAVLKHKYEENGVLDTAKNIGKLRSLMDAPLVPEPGKTGRVYDPFEHRRAVGEYVLNSHHEQQKVGPYSHARQQVGLLDFDNRREITISYEEQLANSCVLETHADGTYSWNAAHITVPDGKNPNQLGSILTRPQWDLYKAYVNVCIDASDGALAAHEKDNITPDLLLTAFMNNYYGKLPLPVAFLLCTPVIEVYTSPAIGCDDKIGVLMTNRPQVTTSTDPITTRLFASCEVATGVGINRKEAVAQIPNAFVHKYIRGGSRRLMKLDAFIAAEGQLADGTSTIVIALPFGSTILQPEAIDLRAEHNLELKRIDHANMYSDKPHYDNTVIAAEMKNIFDSFVNALHPMSILCSKLTQCPVNTTLYPGWARWYDPANQALVDHRYVQTGRSPFGMYQSPESIATLFGDMSRMERSKIS